MGTIMTRLLSGHTVVNRPSHQLTDKRTESGTTETRSLETGGDPRGRAEETWVSVRGVIRSDMVHLLSRYGTAYALLDEQTADYDCALKSDIYRLEDWVGDYVEVVGTLTDGNKGLPVLHAIRLRLLKTKWMR
jgi:hypothetical protein